MGARGAARWIVETVLGAEAPRRVEKDLVEDGRLEVDAPPPGRQRWGDGDLQGNLRDLNGHRCRPRRTPRIRRIKALSRKGGAPTRSPAPVQWQVSRHAVERRHRSNHRGLVKRGRVVHGIAAGERRKLQSGACSLCAAPHMPLLFQYASRLVSAPTGISACPEPLPTTTFPGGAMKYHAISAVF